METSMPLAPSRRTIYPLATLLAGNGGVAALTLLRNILAARFIGLDQFGIAAAFAIVLSAVEMSTTLGAQQLIVRDRRGDEPTFLGSLHLIQLLRGGFGAVVLFLAAAPIASFFQLEEHVWAFRTLALVPLASGFAHLDCWRYQRRMRFGPSIVMQLGPALLTLLLLMPLVRKFGDFRVLLAAALIQAIAMLIMSHLLAEYRYGVTFNRRHLKTVLRFGIPLALNGVLLLAVFHGEKLLIGHLRGSEALALVAMGFSLTLTPALIIGRSLQSFALPQLTQALQNGRFPRQVRQTLMQCIGAALALMAALIALSLSVPTVLGPSFAPLVPLFPMLAMIHGLRVAKTGISVAALALSDTINTVLGNLPRVLALPIIFIWLEDGALLTEILWIAAAAEAMGLILASVGLFIRMRKL